MVTCMLQKLTILVRIVDNLRQIHRLQSLEGRIFCRSANKMYPEGAVHFDYLGTTVTDGLFWFPAGDSIMTMVRIIIIISRYDEWGPMTHERRYRRINISQSFSPHHLKLRVCEMN
jgi:hypothetical protein